MDYNFEIKGKDWAFFCSLPLEGNIDFFLFLTLIGRINPSHFLPLEGRINSSFVSSPLRGED